MYKLYYASGACSMGPHVVLNELSVPFEAHRVSFDKGENKSPEFLKINPRGQIPVLVVDGTPIKEGAAIIMYLLDNHPNTLMPKSGMERAKAVEWLMWANASLHPAYGRLFGAMRQDDPAMKDKLFKMGMDHLQTFWDEAETRLSQSKYLAGDQMTPGDILMTVMANWGMNFPARPKFGPNVMRVIKEVSSRPSYQKALQTEEVEYKAAA